MNPSQVGAIAETAIAAEATRLGFDVYRPVADGGRCDLVFDAGYRRLLRVRCKSAPLRNGVVQVRARTCRRIAGGYQRGHYDPEEVDLIAAYCPELNRCFAVPMTKFGGSGDLYLRVEPTKNGQRAGLHFADDYSLGAIAQLEERLTGSQEVGGSSPPGSTTCDDDDAQTVVGAHEFRNRFGWYMERAAAGEEVVVTRRGKPHLRLTAAVHQAALAA